jgi:putative membrane protein
MKLLRVLVLASAASLAAGGSGDDGAASDTDGLGGSREPVATGRTSDPTSGRSGTGTRDYQPMSSADARILSILHAKNEEEVAVGNLAMERGASEDVRRFADMLVRHHSDNDAKVMQTAQTARITLIDPANMKDVLAREKGMTTPAPDPLNELRGLNGAAFDRAFARKMLDGHRELIQIVENARPTVQNDQVRQLLDETLPRLREHERTAADLANR